MGIKAVLFDLDGVVFSNGSKIAVRRLSKVHGIPARKAREITIGNYAWEYRRGMHTAKEHWGWAAEVLGSRKLAENIRKVWLESYWLKKGMRELIIQIRKHYKTAAVSNTVAERVNYFEKKFGLGQLFDAEIYSHALGKGKPDAEVYHETFERLQVSAGECIFIDNKEYNVRAAEKLGAKGIVFKSIAQLKKDLIKAGVKI